MTRRVGSWGEGTSARAVSFMLQRSFFEVDLLEKCPAEAHYREEVEGFAVPNLVDFFMALRLGVSMSKLKNSVLRRSRDRNNHGQRN